MTDPSQMQWKATKKDYLLFAIITLLFIGQILLALLAFNSRGIDWMVYLGGVLLILSVAISWSARLEFRKRAGVKGRDNWLSTRNLVDTGIFSVIRHPMYLSIILLSVALMLLSQHILSVIFGIPNILSMYFFMIQEERFNAEKLGPEYRAYMERVPRANIVAGVIRAYQRR
jgi:protein-S-isoprenylcysteine O-methyltransferase Ste14